MSDSAHRTDRNVVYGLDAAQRERVAALRAQGRFFWLDVSLSETSRDDLVEALGVPERALRALPRSGDASASRTSTPTGSPSSSRSAAMSSRRRRPTRPRTACGRSRSVSWSPATTC